MSTIPQQGTTDERQAAIHAARVQVWNSCHSTRSHSRGGPTWLLSCSGSSDVEMYTSRSSVVRQQQLRCMWGGGQQQQQGVDFTCSWVMLTTALLRGEVSLDTNTCSTRQRQACRWLSLLGPRLCWESITPQRHNGWPEPVTLLPQAALLLAQASHRSHHTPGYSTCARAALLAGRATGTGNSFSGMSSVCACRAAVLRCQGPLQTATHTASTPGPLQFGVTDAHRCCLHPCLCMHHCIHLPHYSNNALLLRSSSIQQGLQARTCNDCMICRGRWDGVDVQVGHGCVAPFAFDSELESQRLQAASGRRSRPARAAPHHPSQHCAAAELQLKTSGHVAASCKSLCGASSTTAEPVGLHCTGPLVQPVVSNTC